MNAKTLLIPLAAFALTATGVSAFNVDVLEKAGLTQSQISALETAQELRKEGDKDKAREILEKAGIDLKTMEAMRTAMHAHKDAMRTAIDDAVRADDYELFKNAIADSPLKDIVTSKEDFELFKKAHEFRAQGENESAEEIFRELGFEPKHKGNALRHLVHHRHATR